MASLPDLVVLDVPVLEPILSPLFDAHSRRKPISNSLERVWPVYPYLRQRMMASHGLVRRHEAEFRHLVAASLVGARAAGREAGTGWRCDRLRQLADPYGFRRPHVRVGHRDRLDQKR